MKKLISFTIILCSIVSATAQQTYSLEQILNMVNFGGFGVGIGEWRPERDGQFGMYELKV